MVNTNFGCHKHNDGFVKLPADLYSSPYFQDIISLGPSPPLNQFNHMNEIILLFIYVIIVLFAFERRFSDPICNCFLKSSFTNIWLASLTNLLKFPWTEPLENNG